MIHINEYITMRKRIIELYGIIKNRTYRVFFPRSAMFSINQLEKIDKFSTTENVDTGYLERPTLQIATIEQMMNIVPNLAKPSLMGFKNPTHCIEVYEMIQEYLNLWMDVAVHIEEFAIPKIDELYALEAVAEWVFSGYAYQITLKREREQKESIGNIFGDFPLAALMGIVDGSENSKLSFVSYLDSRLPAYYRNLKPTELESSVDWDNSVFKNFDIC